MSADRLLKNVSNAVNKSLATNVLVAVGLCLLLAPGVVLDYSDDSSYLPHLVGGAPNLGNLLNMASLKHAVVYALVLGVFGAVLKQYLNSALKAVNLK